MIEGEARRGAWRTGIARFRGSFGEPPALLSGICRGIKRRRPEDNEEHRYNRRDGDDAEHARGLTGGATNRRLGGGRRRAALQVLVGASRIH